ncbi:MAG: hypothetical protein KGL39_36605 [Patescibacteria group bacterium]|nr:hypothetical protein [Patescibacteria group bacterium]
MPGPVAAPIPLISGSLPGLPSPANGVPSTPDFLSGLLQAVPSAIQGYQVGEQEREQRMKLAAAKLAQIAPIAIQNPADPGTIKTVQQTLKQMGVDPRMALNTDGSLNTNTLMQYSPYFQTFQSMLANPNANPEAVKYLANKLGIKDLPDMGQYTPKQLDEQVKTFQKNLELVGKGQYDKATLVQQAQALSDALNHAGRTEEAYSLLQQANGVQMGAAPASVIGRRDILNTQTQANTQLINQRVGLVKAQTGYYTTLTTLSGARVNLVNVQTQEGAANVARIQADTGRIIAQTQKTYSDIAATTKRLSMEMGRLSATNLGHAVTAASDYNAAYGRLTSQITSLQNTIKGYYGANAATVTYDGKTMENPDLTAVKKQLQQAQALQKQMGGPMDLTKLTQAALHNTGLPNTVTIDQFKIPQSGNPAPQGKGPGGNGPIPNGAKISPDKKQYWYNGKYYDAATGKETKGP